MVNTTIILGVCYVINALALFVLFGYFFRQYSAKRLRASLAWATGFLAFAFGIVTLAFMATGEVSKLPVMIDVVLTSIAMTFFYYGASLLFFREGSFFREKMAVILFVVYLVISLFITYILPVEEIAEKMRAPVLFMEIIVFITIASLFLQVARRLPKDDARKRTVNLVAASWIIISVWAFYIGAFWGTHPILEALVFILGSGGFLLLVYGMTTGKATRA